MLFYAVLMLCTTVSVANLNIFSAFSNISKSNNHHSRSNEKLSRFSRATSKDFSVSERSCKQLENTKRTPFVVIILYQTSGRFLGMGSLLDKTSVLTTTKVVNYHFHDPSTLLVLAGRISPYWGSNSQVRAASEVHMNDFDLALIKVEENFMFNDFVAPIKIPSKDIKTKLEECVVFGIPRSSWDTPGELVSKRSVYVMKMESYVEKDLDKCKQSFTDRDFNDTFNLCCFANGSYSWGCLGSPTVIIDASQTLLQVGVITATLDAEKEIYQKHTQIAPFGKWFRSLNLMNLQEYNLDMNEKSR